MSITIYPINFNKFMEYYKLANKYGDSFNLSDEIDLFHLLAFEKEDGDLVIMDINLPDFKEFVYNNQLYAELRSSLIKIIVMVGPNDKNGRKFISKILDDEDMDIDFRYDECESVSLYYQGIKGSFKKKFANGIIHFMERTRNDDIFDQESSMEAIQIFLERISTENEELWQYIIHNIKDPETFMNPATKIKYMQEQVVDTTIGLRGLKLPDLVVEKIINDAYNTRDGLSAYEVMDKIDGIMHPVKNTTKAARFPSYKDVVENKGMISAQNEVFDDAEYYSEDSE